LKIQYLFYYFEYFGRFENFFSYLDDSFAVNLDVVGEYNEQELSLSSFSYDSLGDEEGLLLSRLEENTLLNSIFELVTFTRLLAVDTRINFTTLLNFFGFYKNASALEAFLSFLLLKGQSGF